MKTNKLYFNKGLELLFVDVELRVQSARDVRTVQWAARREMRNQSS